MFFLLRLLAEVTPFAANPGDPDTVDETHGNGHEREYATQCIEHR
jgi:hypothetical protein